MKKINLKQNNFIANKLFCNAEKQIEKLIAKIGNEDDKTKYNEMIYRILLKRKAPALIMKYLSYIGYYHYKVRLINLLSDEEINEYFDLLDKNEYELVISSLQNDELKIKFLEKLFDEMAIFHIVLTIKLDDNKIKCLDFFEEQYYRIKIAESFEDKRKILTIFSSFSSYYQKNIIENILSEELVKEVFKQASYYVQFYIMENIKDDQFKMENLEKFQLKDQIEILATFRDEKLLLSIISDQKYFPYIMDLLSNITDFDFIERYFDKCMSLRKRIIIIDRVNNLDIKKKLIKKINNNFYREVLESNFYENKKDILISQDVSDVKLDIDKNITFGVELEACVDDSEDVLALKHILNDWTIMCDLSVARGVEIISPILTFEESDLKELKYICDFMEDNGFYSEQSCGGHIHFGFDYFETIDEFNIFLNLYGNVEDILYLISNRSKSIVRGGVNRYAGKFRDKLDEIANLEINWDSCCDLAKYVTLIKDVIGKKRYYGLNLLNMNDTVKNTIEFRMPNGEINFKELILNIKLFAKMMEMSKKINKLLNDDVVEKNNLKILKLYQKLISIKLSEREKVSYLLNILFEDIEERNFYYKRYVNNEFLNSQISKHDGKVLHLSRYSE